MEFICTFTLSIRHKTKTEKMTKENIKNLKLTEKEIIQLFHLVSLKEEECKENTLQKKLYEKLSEKIWNLHPNKLTSFKTRNRI